MEPKPIIKSDVRALMDDKTPAKTTAVTQTIHKKGRKSTNKTMAIPYACVKRLAQKQSGGMRISSDAVYIMERALEDFSQKLITVAKSYTEHRDRKTITDIDVDIALKNLSEM